MKPAHPYRAPSPRANYQRTCGEVLLGHTGMPMAVCNREFCHPLDYHRDDEGCWGSFTWGVLLVRVFDD